LEIESKYLERIIKLKTKSAKLSQKIQVLHVDDDDSQLVIFKTILQNLNDALIIKSVNNPTEAIELIKTKRYDCIITDLIMPIMNGIELTERIRTFSNIPIILYTGQGSEEAAEKAFDVGADDYLMKEMDVGHYKVLINKIEKLVEKNLTDNLNKNLIKSISDSFVIIDDDYEVVYHNENFLGYLDSNSVTGKSILSFIDKESRKDFTRWLIKGDNVKHENVLVNEKGYSYFIEVSKLSIDSIKNKRILLIKDITKYKVISDIKDLGEDRFLSLVEVIPDGIMTLNLKGYVTYVNPAFCSITGFSEEEILGSHAFSIKTMANRDVRPYWNVLKNLILGKKVKESFEFPYTNKDGSSGIGEAFITFVKFKGKREFITILKDVTKKKMKEEEYENIFKSSPDGIIHLDINGNIKAINEKGLEIFGLEQDFVLDKNILDFGEWFVNESFPLERFYENIISGREVKPFDIRLNQKNNFKFIEMIASLIEVNNEKLGIQVVIRDITYEKERKIEREKYTKNLEELVAKRTKQIVDAEKMAAIGEMSSMIAHDLKGPLQTINNSLHLIKRDPNNLEKYIDYISDSVRRCNEMLLELSLNTKNTPLNKEWVSIANIIRESIKQIELIEKIEYEVDIKSDRVLYLDKSKFIRVFDNIFKNAIEAMPNGGKIMVTVEEKNKYIIIKVIDTGVGIPENKLKNIFIPFQSTKIKGMGLGLVFCKNTIESHCGEITILSEQNKGTTIMITLPVENLMLDEYCGSDTIKTKDNLIN
jgi:two-component system sporulation sensor kinase A